MEAIDGLLDSALNKTERIKQSDDVARNEFCDLLITDYNDAIANLNRLIEMCDNYGNGQYRIIVTKQYVRSEYAD